MPSRISSSGTRSHMVCRLFFIFFLLCLTDCPSPQTTTFPSNKTRSRVYVVLPNVVAISTRHPAFTSFFWSTVVLLSFLIKNLSLVSLVTPSYIGCRSYPPSPSSIHCHARPNSLRYVSLRLLHGFRFSRLVFRHFLLSTFYCLFTFLLLCFAFASPAIQVLTITPSQVASSCVFRAWLL